MKKRPTWKDVPGNSMITTPRSTPMVDLLGGSRHESVLVSNDQMAAMRRVYGVTLEHNKLIDAGNDRNLFRAASDDGLRLVAWLAHHLEPGEDPLRVLVRLAIDAGWEINPEDIDWAEEDEG